MAVPALTSNSPVAGSISWVAFHIVYGGIDYAVSAGNTNLKYVGWIYNGGSPLVVTSNNVPVNAAANATSADWAGALPTIGPDDMLLFVNKNGIPINLQATNMIDGDLVVTGSIVSSNLYSGTVQANLIQGTNIAADTITANQIQADAIGTSELAANAVIAENIAAGAVTTAKLTVGSLGSNHIMNATFEDVDPNTGVLTSWRNNFLGGTATVGNSTSTFVDGARSGLVSPTTTLSGDLTSAAFPVVAGQTLYVTGYFAVSAANIPVGVTLTFGASQAYTTASLVAGVPTTKNITLNRIDTGAALTPTAATTSAGRANLFGAGSAIPTINVIHQFSGQVVIPSGASWASLSLQGFSGVAGNVYWDDVECDSVVISAVIGDGQITANNIAANAITAGKISATAIDGMTITGAVLKTAATGPRIEIYNGSIGPYPADYINFYDGTNTVPGQIYSAQSPGLASIEMISAAITGYAQAHVTCTSRATATGSMLDLSGDTINLYGHSYIQGSLTDTNGYPYPVWGSSVPGGRTFDAGRASWTTTASLATQTFTVTCGGPSGAVPWVLLTPDGGGRVVWATSRTANGFTINVQNTSGTNIASGVALAVMWLAIM